MNPQPFAANCRFFDKVPINARIQQDAQEFLGMLLEQLHDDLYKGVSANIMEGEGFQQAKQVDFYTLEMNVQSCNSFEESLQAFLQQQRNE
jgi:ubiquitin C-terminal hydrolase